MAGQAGWRVARGPIPREEEGWREAPGPPGEGGQLCEGLAKALSPGMRRLALRGRVAHRVLISTKSLQRRRARVLLLLSYLQEPEAQVTGRGWGSACPRGPRQGCVMLWGHPGLSLCI